MITGLRKSIPETLDGTEYKTRTNEILKMINLKKNEILKELNEIAVEYGFRYTPTEQGLLSIPLKGDTPISEEEYQNLSAEEIEKVMERYNELHLQTMDEMNQLRETNDELERKIKRT